MPVYGFDRGDIQAAGRRSGDQDLRVTGELAPEHDLLEIASGELAGDRGRARPHVRAPDQLLGLSANAGTTEERTSRMVAAAVGLEDDVRSDEEAGRNTGAGAIL